MNLYKCNGKKKNQVVLCCSVSPNEKESVTLPAQQASLGNLAAIKKEWTIAKKCRSLTEWFWLAVLWLRHCGVWTSYLSKGRWFIFIYLLNRSASNINQYKPNLLGPTLQIANSLQVPLHPCTLPRDWEKRWTQPPDAIRNSATHVYTVYTGGCLSHTASTWSGVFASARLYVCLKGMH